MTPKQKADKWFSIFIRLRDADENGLCRCITCPRIAEPKKMDCGHFIKRQYLTTRYNERNCHAQCKHCNAFEQGKNEVYAREISKRYGEQTLNLLYVEKTKMKRMTRWDYEQIAEVYKTLAAQLSKEKKIPLW